VSLIVFTIGIGISQYFNRRELLHITYVMDNFQHVDRIVITMLHETLEIDYADYMFEDIRATLYPFSTGRVGIPASTKRVLLNNSHEQTMQILYFINGDELFSLSIYEFGSSPPFPPLNEQSLIFIHNMFIINNSYALAFINDGNFVGSFSFDVFDSALPYPHL